MNHERLLQDKSTCHCNIVMELGVQMYGTGHVKENTFTQHDMPNGHISMEFYRNWSQVGLSIEGSFFDVWLCGDLIMYCDLVATSILDDPGQRGSRDVGSTARLLRGERVVRGLPAKLWESPLTSQPYFAHSFYAEVA